MSYCNLCGPYSGNRCNCFGYWRISDIRAEPEEFIKHLIAGIKTTNRWHKTPPGRHEFRVDICDDEILAIDGKIQFDRNIRIGQK